MVLCVLCVFCSTYHDRFGELLAELMENDIKAPRQTKWRTTPIHADEGGHCRPPKYSPTNRLLFVLEWLSSGDILFKQELQNKLAKNSLDEDRKHVLGSCQRSSRGSREAETTQLTHCQNASLIFITKHCVF